MATETGAITITDKAKERVEHLIRESSLGEDYFLRVGVVGGGCSGLSYKLDFDNEIQANDQVFEDKGIRVVTDIKSFPLPLRYCAGFYRWVKWQGIPFHQS